MSIVIDFAVVSLYLVPLNTQYARLNEKIPAQLFFAYFTCDAMEYPADRQTTGSLPARGILAQHTRLDSVRRKYFKRIGFSDGLSDAIAYPQTPPENRLLALPDRLSLLLCLMDTPD